MKLFSILLLLSSCGTTAVYDTGSDSSDTVIVKNHESFEIKLATNLGTGYSWTLRDSAFTTFLSVDTLFTISNPQGIDNAMETQVFRFTALKTGSVRLHFLHKRPWKKDEKPDQEKEYLILIE